MSDPIPLVVKDGVVLFLDTLPEGVVLPESNSPTQQTEMAFLASEALRQILDPNQNQDAQCPLDDSGRE